jgi:uncharacterized membrane protein
MAYCQSCGSPVEARFCAKCGAPTGFDPSAPPLKGEFSLPGKAAGLSDNLAAALSYIPIIGLIFLLLEPYSRNRMVRFHAIQSILLVVAMWVTMLVITSVFEIMGGLLWTFYPLIRLAFFAVFILAAIRAYKGVKMVLPVIGPLAEKWA